MSKIIFRPRRERIIKELRKGRTSDESKIGNRMKNDEGAQVTRSAVACRYIIGTAVRMVISICKDYPDN